MTSSGLVLAVAGRRIDAADAAERRFPLENVGLVAGRVHGLIVDRRVAAVVSSAACGADLIALTEAGRLKRRRRVVLPGERERFKQHSVVDRPGDWAPVFDGVIDAVAAEGDLVTIDGDGGGGYAAANEAILDEAQRIARGIGAGIAAAIVWEGQPRGDDDVTAMFKRSAERRGFEVVTVLTV